MVRKTFVAGQVVEIQRTSGAQFELARYLERRDDGWHCVELNATAPSCPSEEHPKGRRVHVPSRRIRKFGHPHGGRRP